MPEAEGRAPDPDAGKQPESTDSSELLAAALSYAQHGWQVLPLHTVVDGACTSRRGMGCRSPGKHPRTEHGVKDANSDPDQIRKWWKRWPTANVGIACGSGSRLIVVDIDPRNGGSLEAIEARHGELPLTVQSKSGGGGVHLLFRADGGRSCNPSTLQGVNILAEGKLFVAPPSLHLSEQRYRWSDGRGPTEVQVAQAPPWLTALCAKPEVKSGQPDVGTAEPASSHGSQDSGERVRLATAAMLSRRVPHDENDGTKRLYTYACRAVEYDLSDAEAIRAVRAAEQVAPFPRPFDDDDVVRRLRDAERKATRGKRVNAKSGRPGVVVSPSDRKRAVAIELAEIADEIELWHTPDGDAYATILHGDHVENWPVRSRVFKTWLTGTLYRRHKITVRAQQMEDALLPICARAIHDGPEHETHLRIAGHGGDVYVDLGDAQWRCIQVTQTGWNMGDGKTVPVKFRRARGMLPLPIPQAGGHLAELRKYINVGDGGQFVLVLAWLVAALRPSGPFPVLCVTGEQGSAKSSLCRALRSLVDPNQAALRSAPRDERDLSIATRNGWVCGFDNLSGVPDWLSDALCRVATGGGFATRELFTDWEEVIFSGQRPIIVNGITDVVSRPDLLDRAIMLTLPTIAPGTRRTEADLWAEFESARPWLFGATLDAVAVALRQLPSVKLDSPPRMADFATWAVAAEPAFGLAPGTFLAAYRANRMATVHTAIESSDIGPLVIEMIEESGEWSGTATELLAALELRVNPAVTRRNSWPKTARSVSSIMRQLAPNLRLEGVEYDPPTPNDKRRIHTLRRSDNLCERPPTPPNRPKNVAAPPRTPYSGGRSEERLGGGDSDRPGDRPGGNPVPDPGNTVAGGMGGRGGHLQAASQTSRALPESSSTGAREACETDRERVEL